MESSLAQTIIVNIRFMINTIVMTFLENLCVIWSYLEILEIDVFSLFSVKVRTRAMCKYVNITKRKKDPLGMTQLH